MPTNLSTNPLLPIVHDWWLCHKESIDGMALLTDEKLVAPIIPTLSKLVAADDIGKTANQVPLEILDYVTKTCSTSSNKDIKRSAAAICQLLSVCVTLSEERKLIMVQGELELKIREYEPDKSLHDDIWDYIEETDIPQIQAFLRNNIFEDQKQQIMEKKVKALIATNCFIQGSSKVRHSYLAILGCWLFEHSILPVYGQQGFNVSAYVSSLTQSYNVQDVQIKYIYNVLQPYRDDLSQRNFSRLREAFPFEYSKVEKL